MSHKANYDKAVSVTVYAAAAIDRGLAVTMNGSAQVTPAAANTVPNFITMAPATFAGEAIQGAIPNGAIVAVKAGAAVSLGDVTTDANGKFVNAASGNNIVGTALTAADAADEYIAIQFFPRGTAA